MTKTRRRLGAIVTAGVAVAALFACNVFATIDRCDSDGDCPTGSVCDPLGRYCASLPDAAPPAVDAADAAPDRTIDAPIDTAETGPPECDARAPFTSFSIVRGFEDTTVVSARLTADERDVVYSALNGSCSDESCLDLVVAHRDGLAMPFAVLGPLPGVNCNMASEYWATLSADGKLVFFESARALEPEAGACGSDRSRIWSATRVSVSTDFGPPRIDSIFALDGGSSESAPYLHPNGHSLYFVSIGRPGAGGQDIYVATIGALGLVNTVAEVTAVNTPDTENFPVITLDEKTLYFARLDPPRELWVTHRETPVAAFEKPHQLQEFVGPYDAIPAWVSDDRCRFYFTSNRDPADSGAVADYRLWVAERKPQ